MLRVGFALLFGWATVIVVAPIGAQPAEGQTPTDAAAQLAGRIASLLPRGTTVSLEFQNLDALAPNESSNFRDAFPQELRKAGIAIAATGQAESRLRISASENVRGRLLVAEILKGDSRQVAMMEWSRAPAADTKPRVTVASKLIWHQSEPILDFLLVDAGAQLVVLEPAKVASYRLTDGKWAPSAIASFSMSRPMPRDRRGRIEIAGGAFRVYLPGTTCTGELAPALRVTCSAGNDAFADDAGERWISDRNLVEAGSVRGAFYSEGAGLFAAAGGRITDRAGQTVPGSEGWGSDIADAGNPCASKNTDVLASAAGDDPARDQVQVHEIANGHAMPLSKPLSLPGQVTALWPSETPGQTTLIIRNAKTGEYEAYRLGLACAE